MQRLRSLEICAGAGGQALGLEQAGFDHLALVEIDAHACMTLRFNRPRWNVIQADLREFNACDYRGVDLLAGGVPCPPFSIAGKQLGEKDERNLFPEVIRLVHECSPKAVMIENVRGLMDPMFDGYRASVTAQVESLGYTGFWRLLNASDFGVPQLRPRVIFVALKHEYARNFSWPQPNPGPPPTVGQVLFKEMGSRGWSQVEQWRVRANQIAPTLVGGSKKHGGPDLGPTRARKAWAALGVDGGSLADKPPGPDFEGMPRLTTRMAALIQGFPEEWPFVGRKTPAYRQIGNAFPPPVAKAVGERILQALQADLVTLMERGIA